MSATTLTPDRVLRSSRRISSRALVGMFLALAATAASLYFWASVSDTRPVLVAVRDLPVGTRIEQSDLSAAQVKVPDDVYLRSLVPSSDTSLAGQVVTEPIHAGQIVQQVQLDSDRHPGPGLLALTIAANPETAAGGAIDPGDHVQVLLTRRPGEPESTTEVVLQRATVYAVRHASTPTSLSSSSNPGAVEERDIAALTLIVSPGDALKLANAKWNGELDVALLPPMPR